MRHPKEILVIAQPAASALHVRLLHVDAVAKFCVARHLILHAAFNVFALMPCDALRAESFPEKALQVRVTGEKARLEQGGLRSACRRLPARWLRSSERVEWPTLKPMSHSR